MKVDKNAAIIKELSIENKILKEKIAEKTSIINDCEFRIENLTRENYDKEKTIQDILNSKTFKFADKIGKLFRRRH